MMKLRSPQRGLDPYANSLVISAAPADQAPTQAWAPTKQAAGANGETVLGYASARAECGEYLQEDIRIQRTTIAAECRRRGVALLRVVHERDTRHRGPLERPGLGYALERIAAGEAGGLVISELHRIAHSVPELGGVLEWLADHNARFVVAAAGVDTAEDAGRLTVQTIIHVSRSERQRLVERTRRGMIAARRHGPASVSDYPELSARIARMRGTGMTLQAIADQLNAEGIPTVRGGAEWRPSSVQAAAGYRRRSAKPDPPTRAWSLGK
jgi:DNA invertase Pin-like site-specific DNA recombinase